MRAGSWLSRWRLNAIYLGLLVSKVCTYDFRMFGRSETPFYRRPRTSSSDEFVAFLDIQRLLVKFLQCHLHGSRKLWGEPPTSRRPKDHRSTSTFNAQMHSLFLISPHFNPYVRHPTPHLRPNRCVLSTRLLLNSSPHSTPSPNHHIRVP